MNISNEERADRLLTVNNAVATQQIEGLTIYPKTVTDLEGWANGEMMLDAAKARCFL